MINLLPPDMKKQLLAGRTNVLLLRYLWLMAGLLSIVVVIAALGYLMLDNSKANYQRSISDAQQKAESYSSVAKAATSFKSNLDIASAIFGKQTNYTSVILEISAHLPAGTALESLSLDSANFGKPLSLNVKVKDEATGMTLKDTLQKSKYFTDVKLESLIKADGDKGDSSWRAVVSITIDKKIMDIRQ